MTLEKFLRALVHEIQSGAPDKTTHLFLVGDIFDLWIGSHAYFREKFESLIDVIRELVRLKVDVHFFEGNHDLHLHEFWQTELGVQVHADAEYFQLGAKIVRVEHGDLMNPEDKGYLFLRKLLRLAPVRLLALHLPSRIVALIGERASSASRTYTSTAKELPKPSISKLIRDHAERAYAEKPFDLIITGHVHVRDDAVINEKARSVNLGSWFDGASAFLLTETRAEFVDLSF